MVSSSALVVAALMASQTTHGFQIYPRTAIPATAMKMSSKAYEEQLRSYSQAANGAAAPQTTSSSSLMVSGSAPPAPPQPQTQPQPVAVSAPPPVPAQPQQVQQQSQQPQDSQIIEVKDTSAGGLGGATGVLFLGLPLWILLSMQLFLGGNTLTSSNVTPAPMAPVTSSLTLPVPATTNNGAPAGVVVLSQPITKSEVRGLFELWNDALQTGDPATVAKRYAKDGVLLPTLSDVPRNDFEGIKDYFVGFLKKRPVGKILEGEVFIGNNWAQDAGIYEFTFNDGSKVKARYSFVYAFEDGKWMISHHHSSLMPQEVVRPTKITESEVRGFFDVWNKALATGEPQKVADCYSKDAVLLPTLSDSARYTNDRIADYFVGFLKKKPQGEILEGNIKIGPNWAQDAGIYEFTFEDGSKTRGRYSYVYTFENGEWKISNHHSSIMPEPAVAAFKKVKEMEKSTTAAATMVDDMDRKMAEMDAKVAEMNKKFAMMEKSVNAVSEPSLVEVSSVNSDI